MASNKTIAHSKMRNIVSEINPEMCTRLYVCLDMALIIMAVFQLQVGNELTQNRDTYKML